MADIVEQARTQGLLFDGGMGTMFMDKGLTGGEVSEYWTLEEPEIVTAIHREYWEAGADVITANTFGGSAIKLARSGLDNQVEAINTRGVAAVREAVGQSAWVAGDLGPTGEMLAPSGPLDPADAQKTYREQAGYLAAAGVDLIIVETMFDLNEALAAVRGAREACDLPLFATMTFQETAGGFVSIMGNPAVASLKELLGAGASVVGANCSLGSDSMLKMAQELRQAIDAPLICQPNAGMPETRQGQTYYPEDAAYYTDNLLRLKEVGIEIIGGCCGTTPDFIRAIKTRLG